jgi:hypothetical protein
MEVTARKSSRRYTGFQWKLYEPNWELSPYEEIILSQGTPAYYIDVFRDIRYRDGSKTTEKWTVYYNDPKVIETHPCNIPGSGVSCPSPPVVIPPGVIV